MKQKRFLAALAAFALCFGGCSSGSDSEDPEPEPEPTPAVSVVLSATPTQITANGTDAVTFKLTANGTEVASGYTVYNSTDGKVVGSTFTTTTAGTYTFYATYNNNQSNTVTVTAVEAGGNQTPDNPETGTLTLPTDPKPENTNFARNVLLMQFTGTGCGYCPYMINTVSGVLKDDTLAKQVIWTAVHRFNSSDPAYCSVALDYSFGVQGYPTLWVDMASYTQTYNSTSYVKGMITKRLEEVTTRGGIAAASKYDSATRTITITTEVKAAEKREFYIGVWVLEDGIVAYQSNYGAEGDWSNYTHNGCVRMCDSNPENTHRGHALGALEAGQKAVRDFTITLNERYVADNCRLVIFITTPEVSGASKVLRVNNAITLPLNGSCAYAYTE